MEDGILSEINENTKVLEETEKTLDQIDRFNKLIDIWVGEN